MSKLGLSLVAGRYAKALFALAKEQNVLDAVSQDMARLRDCYSESAIFQDFAVNKLLSRQQQEEAAGKLSQSLNLQGLVGQLLGVLAQNRRMDALIEIADAYNRYLLDERKIVPIKIVSSSEMEKQQADAIVSLIEGSLGTKVSPTWKVDASLLGGVTIKIGSTLYDCSLAGKLRQIESLSKEVIAA